MKELNSKLYSIGTSDGVKAFWLFLSTTVISIVGDAIMQAISSGNYSLENIHWKEIGCAVLAAVIGYLKVKFLTNSKGEILTKDEQK